MTSDTLSPSDIANFLACRHLTALDRQQTEGRIRRPYFSDPSLDVLRQLGSSQEQEVLARLQSAGTVAFVEISTKIAGGDAAKQTLAAIRSGAGLIYQPLFLAHPW
jgi:uncharacterized protein